MTALAIDTSLDACAVALAGPGLALERREIMERGHAERLPLMVKEVMAEARLGFDQLSRVAVTIGPGTFTGIRIGLAFARGLGLALGIPVIGYNTLEATALGIAERPLLIANHARDEDYYAQVFGGDVPLGPGVFKLADLPGLKAKGRAAGDFPAVLAMARLAHTREAGVPPEPLYLRAADAKPQAPVLLVRAATLLEAPVLAALHGASFDEGWTADSLSQMMAMPGANVHLALASGEPAGFLLARDAADETEIITVAVAPQQRRRGIASALIRRLEKKPKVFLEVAAGNTAARALYTKLGFAAVGERKGYYASGEDAIVMNREQV